MAEKGHIHRTLFFQKGRSFYLVGGVHALHPTNPGADYAYGSNLVDALRDRAPNNHIGWLGGHYVSADTPNRNGAMWTSADLAVKSLTPNLMPVTVMHDPELSVGMIADARLLTPEKDGVERASIETALGIWKHRYPEVYEEAMHNLEQGTLAQSMECLSTHYECSVCGESYRQAPNDPTSANSHCSKNCDNAARILRNFTFAGSGLIFGSRGAIPGDPDASLELLAQEVAEFHQRTKVPPKVGRDLQPKKRTGVVEINDDKYETLVAQAAKAEKVDQLETDLAAAKTALEEADKKLVEIEAAKVAAETAKADLEKKVKSFEDRANEETLKKDRLGKLGEGFTAKLGEIAKSRLADRAGKVSDEEWASYLSEIEELVGVKSDEGKTGGDDAQTGGADTASFKGGSSTVAAANVQAPRERQSIYAGL